MKQQIDKLIANALLDEGEVYLPGKGSLILRRHAAKFLSSSKLQTPYRELTFTPEERGTSLITLISKIAKVSEERASDIFNEWISQSTRVQSPTRNTLVIYGVATIATSAEYSHSNDSYRKVQNTVTTDQKFENMANPKGRGIEKINPRPKYFIYILIGTIVGMAIGVTGTYFYANGAFDQLLSQQSVIPASTTLVAAVQEQTAPTEPASAVVEEPTTSTETKVEESVQAEQAPTEATEQVAEPTAEPVVEPVAEPTAEPVIEQTAEPTTEQTVAQPVTERPEPTIKPFKQGSSYLVWGLYRKLGNAQKAIASLAEKHPSLQTNLHHYGGSYMLTIYEGGSRAECNKQMAAWQKQDKSFAKVWVFTH